MKYPQHTIDDKFRIGVTPNLPFLCISTIEYIRAFGQREHGKNERGVEIE
jgi:hypothetical protein